MALPPHLASVRRLWPRFVLYQLLLHLAAPVLLVGLALRARKEPLALRHFSHRLGLGPSAGHGVIWIFAASLGEVRAAQPLIGELLDRGQRVSLTVTSPAGLAEARRLYPDHPKVAVGYAPLDLAGPLALFLWRQKPGAYLAVESEIWPGKLMLTALAGIPRAQVNGNLVDRTLTRRIAGRPNPILPFLGAYDLVLTKSETHRARYLKAGVEDRRIVLAGELKFDLPPDQTQIEQGLRLKSTWAPDRPVFLIASSVAGEERALRSLCQRLTALPHPPHIIWAPRSPQRFDPLAEDLTRDGMNLCRRSETSDLGRVPAGTLLFGDTLGEMSTWYAAADLVFVGASLVDHGGHNIVEPLAQGRPVVMGPSTWGIAFPAEDAARARALTIAPTPADLPDLVERLLTRPDALAAQTRAAAQFSAAHLGAAQRSADALAALLPPASKMSG